MRTRLLVAGAFLALFALAAPAAAGGGGHGICDGFTTGNEIVVHDSCFQGAAHFAEAGATVRVVNQGFATHDVTAVDGTFASGPLEPGATFDLVVDERGAIPYYCTLHGTPQGQGMAGVLIVGNGDATAPALIAPAREVAAPATAAPATGTANGAVVSLAVAALVVAVLALAAALELRLRRRERGSAA